jgi:signal transduction histidine kinase/CheY-like chemotaxis protein
MTRRAPLNAEDELALQRILAGAHSFYHLDVGPDGGAAAFAQHVARALLSERKAAHSAELRLMNERLADAMRAKDAFLAGMSHELRTPLNTILGLTEMLTMGAYGALNEQQRRALTTIDNGGQHLLRLINDILDLAKIEAGREELDLELVRPAEVCGSSLRLVADRAIARGITIERHLPTSAPPLMADRRRMTQILVNLLDNALKFTPPGGRVGLELASDERAEAIRLTVWDSGAGIAPKQQERLFQAFTQADEASRLPGGSGLGLALVARLVRLHGGCVALESAAGAGCRFSVALPCTGLGAPAGDRARFGRPTALVIDEHEPSAQALAGHLRASGFDCLVATGDAEVNDLARLLAIAVVFVALPMDDHQGAARLPRLRAAFASETRIVAIGSVILQGSTARALAAGADAYLPRPLLPEAVAKSLRALEL